MNGQRKIIEQCDKMIKLLDDAQTSLGEASRIAKDYLEYRSKVKNISSNPMLADSKTILHRCSCEEGSPVEVKICLNCDGILE